MALRDQPYLPLFIQDFLTDEKLAECSASATGVYIRIMCLMHKSETYGKILLKQKHKQTLKQVENFALLLVKHLPYDLQTVCLAITELVDEGVLIIEDDFLIQKRMVKDNSISCVRSKSGSKGGKKTQSKDKDFAKAKSEANTEYEIEYENENEIEKGKESAERKTINIPFENFWNLYDKKVGEKTKLEKKWKALKPEEREKAIKHIVAYKISQPEKKFRKDPATYLNNKSFNDEIITTNGNQQLQSIIGSGNKSGLGTSDARIQALQNW